MNTRIALRPPLSLFARSGLAIVLTLGSFGIVSAGNPLSLQRLGRQFGFGWGDGYHGCRDSGLRLGADRPPHSYHDLNSAGKNRVSCNACDNVYPPNTARCETPGAGCDDAPAVKRLSKRSSVGTSLMRTQPGCDTRPARPSLAHLDSACDGPACDGFTVVAPPMHVPVHGTEIPGVTTPIPAPQSTPDPMPPAPMTPAPMPPAPATTETFTPASQVPSTSVLENVSSPSDETLLNPAAPTDDEDGEEELLLDQANRTHLRARRLGGATRPQTRHLEMRPETARVAVGAIEQPSQQTLPPNLPTVKPMGPAVKANPFFPQTRPNASVKVSQRPSNVIFQPR